MARKPPKGNSLAEKNPKLAKQWHTSKNGDLTPFDFTNKSGAKVWWKCDKGEDHEWLAHISSRSNGVGCSVCNGRTVVLSNCLATTHPKITKQWHPTRNGDLTPFNIISGSHKKVWWKCDKGDDHEWMSAAGSRSSGRGCPICFGQKVVLSNCLATLNPDLAKEWHPTKNGDLTPYDIREKSGKKVWWKCGKGDDHEWISTAGNRSEGKNCPICSGRTVVLSNCLATLNPDFAKEWHPTKNGDLTPFHVTENSGKRVWWKCDKGDDHEWIVSIANRSNGSGCSVCSGKTVVLSNCLATLNPDLAKEWHPTKNRDLTPYEFTVSSDEKVWWKCDKGDDHEWIAPIKNRSINSGCSVCSGKTVVVSNCLATLKPNLVKEWHPTKNGNLTPYKFTVRSNKKVWWKCDKGDDHEWIVSIAKRSNGSGCSICAGQTVVLSNCLATLSPDLAKEWHPTKNGDLTPYEFSTGTDKKVWWKCDKGDDHEWITSITNRSRGRGCPFCTLTPQSRQELTITFELIQFFKDINPKGFKTRVKGKLWSIDIYIPQLKLGIEFDGSYWHKDKRALDKLKTEELEEEGFEIFRVRQEPLKRIFEDDIMSKQPFNAKQVANDILTQIMSRYSLNTKKITKIESYIAKKELQNVKGLDKYIEMILTEKAEKKLI